MLPKLVNEEEVQEGKVPPLPAAARVGRARADGKEPARQGGRGGPCGPGNREARTRVGLPKTPTDFPRRLALVRALKLVRELPRASPFGPFRGPIWGTSGLPPLARPPIGVGPTGGRGINTLFCGNPNICL